MLCFVKPINIENTPTMWVQEIKYLGINFASESRLIINFQPVKHKFFGALDGIFRKVGLKHLQLFYARLLIHFVFLFCFMLPKHWIGTINQ